MRIHDKLDEILKHGSKIKILRFLFAEKDEHTGRSIAKGISMSPSSTHRTLLIMADEGLISSRKKGKAILYMLRQDHYVVRKLLGPLFEKEKLIYSDIISLIKRHLLRANGDIATVAVFGSVVRKEETSGSDIDLLVILRDKSGKSRVDKVLDNLHADIVKSFGASLSPYVLTVSEIRHRHNEKKRIIKSILDNNELIYGEPVERILA